MTKLALSSQHAGIVRASARFFNILINGEADGMLDSRIFARCVVDLARCRFGNRKIAVGEKEEGDLLELLFAITTKIRQDPSILSAWTHSGSESMESTVNGADKSPSRWIDFPLFYVLVEHVHKDGRTGDFARTGLLYLTDTASRSRELEKWMIESDLATLMASGLGALYSRLNPRLPARVSTGTVTATTDTQLPPPPLLPNLSTWYGDSEENLCPPDEFRTPVDAFLQYLLFWQDTVNHCQSAEVKDTLIDHFRLLFLQQVLYPSLLESSDVNGRSTAAVLTYLCQILEALDHPNLVAQVLEYLLATPPSRLLELHQRTHDHDGSTKDKKGHRSRDKRMSISRRKSLDALTALAQAKDDPSPTLFNVIDLLIMSLQSEYAPTVTASLRLITVIQQRHHHLTSAALLIQSMPMVEASSLYLDLPELNVRLKHLLQMAEVINGDEVEIDKSYQGILQDVLELLGNHRCLDQNQAMEPAQGFQTTSITPMQDDPLLASMNRLLANFFSNHPIINLALTEAFVSLATCPLTSLNGWLLLHCYQTDQPTEFVRCLHGLIDQIRHFRRQFAGWDTLVATERLRLNIVSAAQESESVERSSNRSTQASFKAGSNREEMIVKPSDSPLRHVQENEDVSSLPSPSPTSSPSRHRGKISQPPRRVKVPATSPGTQAPMTPPPKSSPSTSRDSSPAHRFYNQLPIRPRESSRSSPTTDTFDPFRSPNRGIVNNQGDEHEADELGGHPDDGTYNSKRNSDHARGDMRSSPPNMTTNRISTNNTTAGQHDSNEHCISTSPNHQQPSIISTKTQSPIAETISLSIESKPSPEPTTTSAGPTAKIFSHTEIQDKKQPQPLPNNENYRTISADNHRRHSHHQHQHQHRHHEGQENNTGETENILANAVILQEFILEIAATVQVRAWACGEVTM